MAVEAKCKVEINQQECTGCSICLTSCKREALTIGAATNRFGVYPVQQKVEVCEACGTCYYLCPEPGAITLYN